MNTESLQETQALHAVAAAATAATATDSTSAVVVPYERQLIALSKLRPLNRNVRKSGGAAIPELAASIARVGLFGAKDVLAVVEYAVEVAFELRADAILLYAQVAELDGFWF